MKKEPLYKHSTIFVFISRHEFDLPKRINNASRVNILKNEFLTHKRQKFKVEGVEHWLVVLSGEEDLQRAIFPIIELADMPPAEPFKTYNMNSKRMLPPE